MKFFTEIEKKILNHMELQKILNCQSNIEQEKSGVITLPDLIKHYNATVITAVLQA